MKRKAIVAAGLYCLIVATAAEAEPVDLKLVLAVDISASVDSDEFNLQMGGLAAAFRHPAVVGAIRSANPNGIAVTLVQWSGSGEYLQVIGWTGVRDAVGARAFADRIDRAPRSFTDGATAIGSAMEFAAALIEKTGYAGERRVIDVSGDGINNEGVAAVVARARTNAVGITVNGLAILNEETHLGAYYLAGVVGGPGAFLMTADDYEDFARAIRLKLIQEIGGTPMTARPGATPPTG